MKKLLRNLSVLCFVLAAFLTTGCYEEEIPFLKADHEVVLVGPETGKGTVVIESNLQWTASSDVEWITVDNGFGNHKGTFEFFVAANTTPNERSGKITITSNDGIVSTTVLVRQTSEGTQLVLGKDKVSFTKYAGEYLMSIACNGPWEVASSADWCTVDPDSGDGNGAFKITVEENNTGADRVATITVLTKADGKTEVHQIEVSQSASNAALVVSPESQTLTAEAGQFTLNVATVGTWTASVDSDWIVLSETEGTGDNLITVTASANDTGRERIAVITFTTGPENENRITRQIVVRQAAVDFYLDVPVTDYPLSVEEQTIEIPYVLEGSNVTVTASSSSKWMTVESVADGVATVKVAENTTAIAREGVISFITHGQAGDPIIRQVRVAQAPTINILDVLADEYAVEWVGETFRIPIYSNTPVSARSSEPWCNVVTDGQNLVITVEKNETAVPRVAVVTVTTDSEKGEIISKTTIIRQGAAYSTLVVSPAEKNLYAIAQNFVASILTNNSWTASSDSDWLTIDQTAGTGDYMLNVNVAENKTGQVRVAVITVQTGAENSQRESATITVTQRPEQFYFEVPVRSFLFDKWGGPAKVTFVTSGNEESVVASSNVDWLRVGDMEDGFVNVAVQENKTAEVRTGVVTITCTPVFGDPIAIPVTFTQSPTVNILDVFVDVIDVMARGDEVALPYYANTPVSVSSSEEWCHVSVGVDEDSYTAECCSYSDPQKIIKIEVDPNRTGEARVAFVTIATVNDAGEKITKVITIRQAALYAAL
ncbi:MAG: BACON domain-containing protein, partial [Bacteroidales bacterium]|nr:BACON domain-containing protein [Bacteroidales bacterium]